MPISLDRLSRFFGRAPAATAPAPDYAADQDVAFIPVRELDLGDCPLCGARPTGHLSVYPAAVKSRMRPRIVWWCDACGSGVVPNAAALLADYYEKAYSAEIKKDRAIAPEAYFAPDARQKSRSIDKHLRRVEHQLSVLARLGGPFETVLDFGAGPGYFLKMLDPPTKLAVELDEASAKFLDHIGARRVSLDEVEGGSLDLIMASHALEHLRGEEIGDVLAAMRAKLKPSGLLYVEVPQAALTALRLAYKHEPHTIFFSPAGLEAVVRRAGFEIVERSYRSPSRVLFRDNPVWSPDPADAFQATIGGGMTLVGRRPADAAG